MERGAQKAFAIVMWIFALILLVVGFGRLAAMPMSGIVLVLLAALLALAGSGFWRQATAVTTPATQATLPAASVQATPEMKPAPEPQAAQPTTPAASTVTEPKATPVPRKPKKRKIAPKKAVKAAKKTKKK